MSVLSENAPGAVSWSAEDVARATGGRLVLDAPGFLFSGFSTDSRKALPGGFFIALQGVRHDGHVFVAGLAEAGGKGFLVAEDKVPGLPMEALAAAGAAVVAVPDTEAGLGALGAWHRRRLSVRVVGVTGSNGKTSTKEMAASVLAERHTVLKTQGNLNNQIGLPLTLLRLDTSHEWAVAEMGMNHFGEIARLAQIAAPDIGVITNVGPGHLEGVGSVGGVLAAKKELLDTMSGGVAVLNGDDQTVAGLARDFKGKALFFGIGPGMDARALDYHQDPSGIRFLLDAGGTRLSVRLAMHGACMVANALAAAAVGLAAGIPPESIRAGLEKTPPVPGRQNVVLLRDGMGLVDDTYNSNPGSMAAALDTLRTLAAGGRAFLALGDMRELGRHAQKAHKALGGLAAAMGITKVFATGDYAAVVADGAVTRGMRKKDVETGGKEEITRAVIEALGPGDWVLVKGSRAMGMEEVSRAIQRAFARAEETDRG